MLVSEVAPENAESPMLVSLLPEPNVIVVKELMVLEPSKAESPMLVTHAGITTAPLHNDPLVTTPLVIVKFGVELDRSPVVHRYVPFEVSNSTSLSTVSPFQSGGVPVVSKPMALDVMWAFAPVATYENASVPIVAGALPRK